jgi:hypothetical protein
VLIELQAASTTAAIETAAAVRAAPPETVCRISHSLPWADSPRPAAVTPMWTAPGDRRTRTVSSILESEKVATEALEARDHVEIERLGPGEIDRRLQVPAAHHGPAATALTTVPSQIAPARASPATRLGGEGGQQPRPVVAALAVAARNRRRGPTRAV